MSYYQQNRGNYRSQKNANNSNDGAKRRRPNRWPLKSKAVRENEMSLKRERRSESENYDDTLFKTPFVPQRSPRNKNYDDDRYDRDGDMYNYNDDRYSNFDGPSYNRPRSLASPGRNFESRRRFVEPQHSGAAWNWDKYFNDVHNWQDKHKLAYYKSRCMALEFENQMLFEQVKSLIEENAVFAEERGELPTMLLPNFPGGLKGFEEDNEAAAGASSENKDKEKKEADKEKNKEGEGKKEPGVKTQGPKEPRGLKRHEELEQLYGESAALIQSLETSIQHSFNRSCDTYNPQMWMTEPLNPDALVV